MSTPTRICFLDDYQGVAVDWSPTERVEGAEWTALRDHVEGDDLVAALAGHQVVVAMRERTRFDRDLLSRLDDLELLITTGPGNASFDLQAAADHGVTVCATTGRASGNTAEHAWALILGLLRHLPEEVGNVRTGGWQTTIGTDLAGATLGLVGLGRIGAQMAKVGHAFGMDVIAWSQNLTDEKAIEGGARRVSREELFAAADIVSVHLVLSARSRGLIGDADLRAMKPSAVIVNTSRGPIIDETALLAALTERRIAGAGLDVFDIEPLPSDHPLRTAPGVLATPHIGYVTEATLRSWYDDVVEDIVAWRAGEPIRVLTP